MNHQFEPILSTIPTTRPLTKIAFRAKWQNKNWLNDSKPNFRMQMFIGIVHYCSVVYVVHIGL